MKRILLFLVLATAIQMCTAQDRKFRGDVHVKGDLYLTNTNTLEDWVRQKVDTVTIYAASMGRGVAGDDAIFSTDGHYQRIRVSMPDSFNVDSVIVVCDDGDSPNFVYNVRWAVDVGGSWTNLFTSGATVSGADATSTGEIHTSIDNSKIPPFVFMEVIFTTLTASPTLCSINVIGHTLNGQ